MTTSCRDRILVLVSTSHGTRPPVNDDTESSEPRGSDVPTDVTVLGPKSLGPGFLPVLGRFVPSVAVRLVS